ncbi:MAG: MFS transporter [Planctomycetota bacterium]|nr:MAG: MFS transporter [Planctomycetota bacterium]
MLRKDSSPALAFIFVTVLIDMIGFGIVLPVLPDLIMELKDVTVSQASLYGGWLLFTYAILQFFCGPIVGNLSDRFGRRPVLLWSMLAFGLDYALMGIAPSIAWLFLGRAVAGMAGAAHTTANAYIADVSPPEKRAQNFGLMGAAFGLGFIIGPALGGLLGSYGSRAPFFAAAALALLNLCYGYFVLPESLPPQGRRPFHWHRANTLGTILQLRSYPLVFALAGALFLWMLGHQVLPSIWAYYTKEKFAWSSRDVGVSLAFAGVLMAAVQAGLTRFIVPRLGERRTVMVGLTAGGLGYLGYAAATQGWMMYCVMLVGMMAGLTFPSLNALMSQQIPKNAQGELQGAVASIFSLTSIVGPVVMTQLFGYFSSPAAPFYFPGAAFIFATFLVVLSMIVFLRVVRHAVEPAEVELAAATAEIDAASKVPSDEAPVVPGA